MRYVCSKSSLQILLFCFSIGVFPSCRPSVDDNGSESESVSSGTTADGSITPAKLSQAYLPLGGGTMSGAVTLAGNPSSALHATPKQYVDAYLAGYTISSMGSITNGQVLAWNSGSSQWEPSTVAGGANATQIQSVNVDNTAPTANQTLYYNNGTSKWTAGTLPVAGGGTGATTLTSNGVLYGNGTSAVSALAAMTNGQFIVGKTANPPQAVTMSGDATVDNAGAITIANNAITTAKINNAAVTAAKISGYLSGTIIGFLTFATTNVTLKGGFQTVVNGTAVTLTADTNVAWSGAAGWRYVVLDSAGAATIETIPGAEITADTARYTPTPVFNATLGGYYSSVNTTKRIVGVARGDGTNFVEVITYGSGRNKNDNYIVVKTAAAPPAGTTIQRFTSALYTRGDGATWSDDGTNGTRITINRPGRAMVGATGYNTAGGGVNGYLLLNSAFTDHSGLPGEDSILAIAFWSAGNFGQISTSAPVPVKPGDIFTISSNAADTNIFSTTAGYARLLFRLEEY